MIKHDLRERGYAVHEKVPKSSIVALIWGSLMFVFTFGTAFAIIWLIFDLGIGEINAVDLLAPFSNSFLAAFTQIADSIANFANGMFGAFGQLFNREIATVLAIFTYIITFILTYLGIKLILTIIFCKDKHHSIKLKILKSKAVPICECKEALKVWQVIMINLVPFGLLYLPLCFLSFRSAGGIMYVLPLFVLLFYGSLDITLVLYLLRIKIKDKIDYISIDHHVYSMTLFSKTYVRANKKLKRKQNKEILWKN